MRINKPHPKASIDFGLADHHTIVLELVAHVSDDEHVVHVFGLGAVHDAFAGTVPRVVHNDPTFHAAAHGILERGDFAFLVCEEHVDRSSPPSSTQMIRHLDTSQP